MSRFVITTLLASLLVSAQDNFTLTETHYDVLKNVTSFRMPSKKISGPKDRYHSLSYSISYSYSGRDPKACTQVDFELVSVVRASSLNTDLYVLFLVDGKEMHFGSSRSAIRNPVKGKPWIGERMVFHIPREDFLKFAEATKLGVKLGGVTFNFSEPELNTVRGVALSLTDPVLDPSIPHFIWMLFSSPARRTATIACRFRSATRTRPVLATRRASSTSSLSR